MSVEAYDNREADAPARARERVVVFPITAPMSYFDKTCDPRRMVTCWTWGYSDEDTPPFTRHIRAGQYLTQQGAIGQAEELSPELEIVIHQRSVQPKSLLTDATDDPRDPLRNDPINHPAHYNTGKIEVIDAIEDWGLGFNTGNAVKYIARAKHKGKELEDLRKARWYITREIERLEKAKVGGE